LPARLADPEHHRPVGPEPPPASPATDLGIRNQPPLPGREVKPANHAQFLSAGRREAMAKLTSSLLHCRQRRVLIYLRHHA